MAEEKTMTIQDLQQELLANHKSTLKQIEDLSTLIQSSTVNKDEIGKQIDELKAKQATLEAQIKNTSQGASVDISKKEAAKFSWAKCCKAVATGKWDGADFEKEVCEAAEKNMKAATDHTTTTESALIPVQVLAGIIEPLREQSPLGRLGATFLPGLIGQRVEIPALTGSTTVYNVAEGAAATQSKVTTTKKSLEPNKFVVYVGMTREAMDFTQPAIDALLQQDMIAQLNLEIGYKALMGIGADSEPLGLVNIDGITKVAHNAVFTPDNVIDCEGYLDDAHALFGNLGFLANGKVWRKLRKLKVDNYTGQTTNQAYLLNTLTNQSLKDLLGYNFESFSMIPVASNATSTIFGNWADMVIGSWGGMRIEQSRETGDAFTNDKVYIKVVTYADVFVRHDESFVIYTGCDVS